MFKNFKLPTLLLAGTIAIGGALAGTAFMANAQGTSTNANTPSVTAQKTSGSTTVDTPESPNDPADSNTDKAHGHAPLGGDGVVGLHKETNDTDGSASSETSEGSSTPDTSDQ